ncbi:hypothetical protein lbkm_2564 [Lachnospiraceae bacterium KM106-2]|nr:hypothetical protein lbkm_2564 [Lachnospiraceae bacterium KM106-2]
MDSLQTYVNHLFRNYRKRPDIVDLKQEILTNLNDRKQDLMDSGCTETEAMEEIKQSFPSVDSLIDDNLLIYTYRYHLQKLQTVLMLLCVAFIAYIPSSLTSLSAHMMNYVFIFAIVTLGIIFSLHYKRTERYDETGYVSISKVHKQKKYVWLLWTAFILMLFVFRFVLFHASDIWFHRPINIRIDGPYSLYVLVMPYYQQLITIIIPIAFHQFYRLIFKNEVN